MPAGSEGVVFRVTCVSGYDNVFLDEDIAQGEADMLGVSVQRLPATPEMVAVMEAAIAYRRCTRHEIGDDYGCEQDDAYDALLAAIDAARAAGGA